MMPTPRSAPPPVGEQLRDWRRRRRLSQLDLACDAEISTRHLSFVETGRAAPSREMLLRLAEHLDVPLRDRNALLLAAGYAPVYGSRTPDNPDIASLRQTIEGLLAAHQPNPALAVDRHWTLMFANAAVAPLLNGIAPHLLQPPVNVLRLSLHPDGLAPRIHNLAEWRGHILSRLQRQHQSTQDPALGTLHAELSGYPVRATPALQPSASAVAVALQLDTPLGLLSLLSTTLVFGTPRDVWLSELAIEIFLPADAVTADRLRSLSQEGA